MDCIFCQIISRLQSEDYRTIYSDDAFLVLLDAYPATRGHFLVIPKNHYPDLSSYPDFTQLFSLGVRLAEKIIPRLNARAYTLKLNNGVFRLDNDPQHIGHVHLHVFPRYSAADALSDSPAPATQSDLSALAQQIRHQHDL